MIVKKIKIIILYFQKIVKWINGHIIYRLISFIFDFWFFFLLINPIKKFEQIFFINSFKLYKHNFISKIYDFLHLLVKFLSNYIKIILFATVNTRVRNSQYEPTTKIDNSISWHNQFISLAGDSIFIK